MIALCKVTFSTTSLSFSLLIDLLTQSLLPFSVNEMFDHSQVDGFFSLPTPTRRAIIQENRLTNYGVVRIDLLEHLYSRMYSQRIHEPDESQWRLNFVFNKEVVAVNVKETSSASDTNIRAGPVQLQLRDVRSGEELVSPESFDLVLVATGYSRHGHERMLQPLNGLFADGENGDRPKSERDYRVRFREGAVSKDAGIWLQGCYEESHGVSPASYSRIWAANSHFSDLVERHSTIHSCCSQRRTG
jgi:L-ornithine N5-oxygenase